MLGAAQQECLQSAALFSFLHTAASSAHLVAVPADLQPVCSSLEAEEIAGAKVKGDACCAGCCPAGVPVHRSSAPFPPYTDMLHARLTWWPCRLTAGLCAASRRRSSLRA